MPLFAPRTITRQLLSTDEDSLSEQIARVRTFAAGQLRNIQGMVATDIMKAKVELAKHLNAIRMNPQTVDGKGTYVAEGEWDLLGGYDGGSGPGENPLVMVAGVRSVQNPMRLPISIPLVQ